jgi:diguanylate cyclase (GGDEF)-like protein/PAS domain S-box-containing protein
MVIPEESSKDAQVRAGPWPWFGSFWLQLSLIFGALYFVIVGLGEFYMAEFLTERITQAQGSALHQRTQAIANALAESFHERDREIAVLSRLPGFQSGPLGADWIEPYLNEIQHSFPNYSWIGVADSQGRVQAATSSLLRGASVRERPWFSGGQQGSYVGDAHQAVMLERLLPPQESAEPLRFLDFASPLRGPDGRVRGVIAAHVTLSWIHEVIRSSQRADAQFNGSEVFILDGRGEILHPFNAIGAPLAPFALLVDEQPYAVTQWGASSQYYLTSSLRVRSRTETDLGWRVVLRQPLSMALAPVEEARQRLLLGAAALLLLVMGLVYALARRFSRPIEVLADAAQRIEAGDEEVQLEMNTSSSELQRLSYSLRGMTSRLIDKRRELQQANADLEQKIADRTQQLYLSEQRYRSILENQTEIICRYTRDHRLTYVNQAYCRLFGVNAEAVLNTRWSPVVVPEDLQLVNAALSRLSPDCPMVTIENRILDAQGAVRWGQFNNRATFDAQGLLLEVLTVGRDITAQKHLEQELSATAARLQDLYDHAPCGYCSLDEQGRFISLNQVTLSWLDCSAEQVLHRMGPIDFFPDEGKSKFNHHYERFKLEDKSRAIECDLISALGVKRRVSVSSTALRDEHGRFLMSRSVMHDITELYCVRTQMRALVHEQKAMLDNDLVGIAKFKDRRLIWKNKALERIFGYGPDELLDQPARCLYLDDASYEDVGREAYPLIRSGAHFRKQVQMARKNGDPIWIDMNSLQFAEVEGVSLWLMQDISEMKQYQEQVEHIAFHDPLTGLPNRLLLSDRMRQAFALHDRMGSMGVVCYLDLDGFKPVNDTHGHGAGDFLLKEVARRLQAAVRANDTVARLGGDEFVMLITPIMNLAECEPILRRALASVREPIRLPSGDVVQVSTSMGVVLYPKHGRQPSQLLALADAAMYEAKNSGGQGLYISP